MQKAAEDFSIANLFFPLSKKKGIVFIAAIGFIIYFNSLFGAFLWDDINQIQNNNFVHSLTNAISFFSGSTFSQNGSSLEGLYYRPVYSTILAFIYSLFGPQPFFFHLAQLSIHILNSIFVFLVFSKFFRRSISFFMSLVFLAHPIQVESVAYLASFCDILFFFFGMSALWFFQRANRSLGQKIVIGILLLCSLLSKETGILFSVALFSFYLIYRKKTFPEFLKNISLVILPVLAYFYLRFEIAKVFVIKIPELPLMTMPFQQRIFTMPAIFWFYIKTFFFPKNLMIDQLWVVSKPGSDFYLPLLFDGIFIAAIIALAVWTWRKNRKYFPHLIFFIFWFLIGIGFHLQLVPLDFTVADHMFYFPMVGILGIFSVAMQNISLQSLRFRNIWIISAVFLVCILSIRTILRNANWSSAISLYSHDLKYEKNDGLEQFLANELYYVGNYNQAGQILEIQIKRHPKNTALYYNLGLIYETEGDFPKADRTYKEGLETDNFGSVYVSYAKLLLTRENKIKEAKDIASEGLTRFPKNSALWLIVAISDYKLGNKDKALEEIINAKNLSADPNIDQVYQGILNKNLSF